MEDFFWTGSGDGPPPYIRRPIVVDTDSLRRPTVKTATVVATVYVDGNADDDASDALCLTDCENDPRFVPTNQIPSDRRYWLLTVVSGYLSQRDFPILEQRLAKLYRMAFTR